MGRESLTELINPPHTRSILYTDGRVCDTERCCLQTEVVCLLHDTAFEVTCLQWYCLLRVTGRWDRKAPGTLWRWFTTALSMEICSWYVRHINWWSRHWAWATTRSVRYVQLVTYLFSHWLEVDRRKLVEWGWSKRFSVSLSVPGMCHIL